VNEGRPRTLTILHASGPVGSVELKTLPSSSTPTHSDAVGQETPRSAAPFAKGGSWSIGLGDDHERGEAAAGAAQGLTPRDNATRRLPHARAVPPRPSMVRLLACFLTPTAARMRLPPDPGNPP
jgi:hypothetical protein